MESERCLLYLLQLLALWMVRSAPHTEENSRWNVNFEKSHVPENYYGQWEGRPPRPPPKNPQVCRLLADLAVELLRAEAGSHEKTLQATVTSLARLMRDHEVEADPVAGPANAKRAKRPDCGRGGGRAWTLLRHVLRACWALQRGLEALCCVCLEASPKSLGLLCARPHGLYQSPTCAV